MSFFDTFQAHADDREANKQGSIARRAIIQICKYYNVDVDVPKEDIDFSWFRENFPSFPVKLDSRAVELDVEKAFKALTKTKVWQALMDFIEESPDPYKGIVVTSNGLGTFVIHNAWHLPATAGYTRLTRQAATAEKGIIIEPLAAFLESVKQGGWSP